MSPGTSASRATSDTLAGAPDGQGGGQIAAPELVQNQIINPSTSSPNPHTLQHGHGAVTNIKKTNWLQRKVGLTPKGFQQTLMLDTTEATHDDSDPELLLALKKEPIKYLEGRTYQKANRTSGPL